MFFPSRKALLSFFLALICGIGLFFAVPTFAQEVDLESFAQTAGFTTTEDITVIIARLIRTAITMVGVVTVGFMVYGGFVWLTAGGNTDRVNTAKKIITNSVIGLVIVFGSFGITQFVLNALISATGGEISSSESDGGGTYDDGSSSTVFYLSSLNTQCTEYLQNVQLQFVFSKNVDAETVKDGVVVEDQDGDPVKGTVAVSGRTVTFTPDQACEEPFEDEFCFDANTNYAAHVLAGVVESTTGAGLTCTTTYPCSFKFATGSEIDVSAPKIEMDAPEDGQSVYVGFIELLQALTVDDSGVSAVDFFVIDDDVPVFTAGPEFSSASQVLGGTEENAFFTNIDEEWNTQGYVTNETYEIWAKGYDCAGNVSTAERVEVILRALNCSNEIQDTDLGETGIDCGGDPSSIYYCGACEGDQCVEDSDCSSGQCVDGQCETTPKITKVSPGDGAVGNLVTISGEGFGTQQGIIRFSGGTESGFIEVNAYECAGAVQWSDSQIVVQVPEKALDGPISLTTSLGEEERTDDDYGPHIEFDVNAIERPGICVVNPDSGERADIVRVDGTSFGENQGSSTLYFTNYQASTYTSWSETEIEAAVPSVNAGGYNLQVFTGDYVCVSSKGEPTENICQENSDCDLDAGETCRTSWCSETLQSCDVDADCGESGGSCESVRVGSNDLRFTVQDTYETEQPVISSIDSGWKACTDDGLRCSADDDCTDGATCEDVGNRGPVGQYVTIYGTGFGTSIGSVFFEHPTLGYVALGDTDFPDACSERFWNSTSITIKVPEKYLTESSDPLEFVTHLLRVERADGLSSENEDFVVLDDVPGPAVCEIQPSSGPVNTSITLYGENFGTASGTITFSSEQQANHGLWENDQISSVIVPSDAVTGSVYVTESAQGYTSNSLNFFVGDCREDADICSESEICCANGACASSCDDVEPVTAHYAFKISTGITPNTPRVIVACSEEGVSPSPWEGWSDPEDICVTSSVQAEFSTTMNQGSINTSTVIVEQCTDVSNGDCVNWESIAASGFATDETGFTWSPPTGGFAANTLHRVTLIGGESIQSADGGYLEEDYTWQFTTSPSDAPCEVGGVNVRPSEYTQTEQADVDYSAQLVAANDRCVALSCSGYNLAWESDFDGAVISNSEPGLGICTNIVSAVSETHSGTPATIQATVTNAENEPNGVGELTINFVDPHVDSYAPQCTTACVNAVPWGSFNTPINPVTISRESITLYQCENSLCEPSGITAFTGVDSVDFSGGSCGEDSSGEQVFSIVFEDGELLDANTWYRVVIDGDLVSSCTDVLLAESGSNFGDDENRYFADDFSWVFRTKDDEVTCRVDSVTIDPEQQTMKYVGDRAEFRAMVSGAPDDCSVQGQVLQASAYEWESWTAQDNPNNVGANSGSSAVQDEIVSYMVLDGAIELTTELPEYCTAACVNAGAVVTTRDGVCGNGRVEATEECDDGGFENGDGCSSSCLNEGSDAYGSVCGDGVRDYLAGRGGEDCDDGNTKSGDGCSEICLNEGSRSIGAFCGDGTVDWEENTGGEDCDDGNTKSGDGCSRNCLIEGSTPEEDVYAICGNGEIEPGEDCDPGDAFIEGDGCTSRCLWEGTSSCPTSGSVNCCGNGIVEIGEECDDEEGCSSQCLWSGSSYTYSTPSFCGDGTVGIAEECDAPAGSSLSTGDYAVAQVATGAVVEVNEETGYAVSQISVTVDGDVTADAALRLQCACTTDASCGETLGCGASNCCYDRPRIVEGQVYPSDNTAAVDDGAEGYCRNSAVWMEFDQAVAEASFDATQDTNGNGFIDPDEFQANLYLDLVSRDSNDDGEQEPVESIADCPTGYIGSTAGLPVGFGEKVWRWITTFVMNLFGQDVVASESFACHVPVIYKTEIQEDGSMRVYLRTSDLLEANAVYRLVANGDSNSEDEQKEGVQSLSGVSLCIGDTCERSTFVQSFVVGDEVCDLDRVQIEDTGNIEAAEYESPSPAFFQSTDERHVFVATPQTYRSGSYEEISPIEDVYEWDWGWSSSKTDGSEGDVVAAEEEALEDNLKTYAAAGATGREIVLNTATISSDEWSTVSTVGREVNATLEVTALVCENPWPARDSAEGFPYIEDELPSNFSFYYCRDSGGPGTDDDLPGLESPIDVASLASSEIIQELIFKVEGSSDAIGVRVVPNQSYLNAATWVEEQGFTGSFSDTTLDNYPAVSSGNTVYATAANIDGSSIYSNMYIVSYNDNASANAQEVFDRILENWRFNANTDVITNVNLCQNKDDLSYAKDGEEYVACEWDGDCFEQFKDESIVCDAQKAKLTRDMQRLLDITQISQTIDRFGENNKHCSITKGQSCTQDADCPGTEQCIEGYPEVQSGTFVPALSNSIWSSWNASLANEIGDTLPSDPINAFFNCSASGYDPATCWNGQEGAFICPEASHLYGYQSIGGEAYVLYGQLEYSGNYVWPEAIDQDATDNGTIVVEYTTENAPSAGTPLATGFSSVPLFCDGGSWGDSSLCGDGTQGVGEVCELGDTISGGICGEADAYKACSSDIDCPSSGECFTGSCRACVNPSDASVDGIACSSDGECGTGGVCTAGTTSYACAIDADNACYWDVDSPASCIVYECGNGVIEGTEQCDDGSLNGSYGHCSDTCTTSDAFYCGDGYLAGAEQCDCGTTSNFSSLTSDSWAVTNACVVSNGQYTRYADDGCAYNCTLPGPSCGDGRINGTESCDGDYEEWEGALCSDGITACRSDEDCDAGDVCGSTGYEAAGVGSVCIGGSFNGFACTSDANCTGGGTCSSNTYDLYRYRVCGADCQWPSAWIGPVGGDQQCGNGVVEGDEVCDDGNKSNNDACLNTCVANVCGDDHVYVGVESCDSGDKNGTVCDASYGGSCNYCNEICQYKTSSGGYCGDGEVNGSEYCDGAYSTHLTYVDTATDQTYGACETYESTTSDDDGVQYTCRWLGVCNGGEDHGSFCTLDYDEYVDSDSVSTLTTGDDTNACSGGSCVPPVCADNCGSSCPFAYQKTGLIAQTAGSDPSEIARIYSYQNAEGDTPYNAALFIPACNAATKITADVDNSLVTPPDVDIVFVTDLSGSMQWYVDSTSSAPVGQRRIDYVVDATKNAVEELFDAYSQVDASMQISLVSFSGDIDTTDGVVRDNDLSTSTYQASLKSTLDGYLTSVGGGTSTYNGMEEAIDVLDSSSAEVKIVVLLSDGDPSMNQFYNDSTYQCSSYTWSSYPTVQNWSGVPACVAEISDNLIDGGTEGVPRSDIIFYSAAITADDDLKGYMAHMSSNVCDWKDVANTEECSGNYAYVAQSSYEINEMYGAIVDSILGTSVTFTATDADGETYTTTGEVQPGSDVELPFPAGFVCKSIEQTIPLRNVFYGTGPMEFSDFTLTYCPYE